jgi:hypothetical protein
MYVGTVWFDDNSSAGDTHYEANISRCVLNGDNLVFEFSGGDEGHQYSGECRLRRIRGNQFSGQGSFTYAGLEKIDASVSVEVNEEGAYYGRNVA